MYLIIPLLLLFIVCPADNELYNVRCTCFKNMSNGLFATSSLNVPLAKDVQACVVNHVVYWEEYICPTLASVFYQLWTLH